MDDSSSLECESTSSTITKCTISTSHESELRISTSSTEIKENKENRVIKDTPNVDSKDSIQKIKTNIGTNNSDQMKQTNELTDLKQPVPVHLQTNSENNCTSIDNVKKDEVTIRFKRKVMSTQAAPADELKIEHDLSSNTTSENMGHRRKFQRQTTSSQPICERDFASQKPKNWYIEYKKQVALVKKWRLRSLRAEEKMRLISSQLKIASNIMK